MTTRRSLIPVTRQDSERLKHRSELWMPAMQTICQRHQLPMQDLIQFHQASNVLFSLGSTRVIKLFADSGEFAREHQMLETLGASLGVAIPDIDVEGEIEGWPYLVMTRVQGQTLASRWHGLCARNQGEIVAELGEIMARLHRLPIANLQGLDKEWPDFSTEAIEEIITEERDNGTPAHLLAQLEPFLESVDPPRPLDIRPVIVLGDIQPAHLLCTESNGQWHITGMVDFADAMLGQRERSCDKTP